jgi:hypothetical protein
MAIPKTKPGEPKKKKTLWTKLKGSALFVLGMIVLFTTLIVVLIIMLSSLLATGDPWPWG